MKCDKSLKIKHFILIFELKSITINANLMNFDVKNTMNTKQLPGLVLASLRRIVRAIDLQSRQLVRSHGLTGPQALLLGELFQTDGTTVGRLAGRVSLSQATVTDILKRLEQKGLVIRRRSSTDKRCVQVCLTPAARDLMQAAPPVLQEKFLCAFNALQEWEQHQLIASLQRVADMMDVRYVDATAGVLRTATATPATVESAAAAFGMVAGTPASSESPSLS